MSGLRKAKKYDWKDSNLALFGSDLEKNVKKGAAETEEAWQGAGQEVGLQIWRVVKFQIKDWPKEDYGKFYNGDSYIILNTYKPDPNSEELAWDLHFWIGQYSSQDEYGTAAYKTVELDTLLNGGPIQHREVCSHESELFHDYFPVISGGSRRGVRNFLQEKWMQIMASEIGAHFGRGKFSSTDEYGTAAYKTVELDTYLNDGPVQHREVMGHESATFKSYFKSIELLEGGADTGFKHVTPEEYKPRLLRFSGTMRNVTVKEVPLSQKSLNTNDVFILDKGLVIYQWNGTGSNAGERVKAAQFCQSIEDERNGRAKAQTIDEDGTSKGHDFYESLIEDEVDGDEIEDMDLSTRTRKLFKVSDADGSLDMDLVKEGDFTKDDLDTNDAFVIDDGKQIVVWIGNGASSAEKRKGFQYAHQYVQTCDVPYLPVTIVGEGQRSASFEAAFA